MNKNTEATGIEEDDALVMRARLGNVDAIDQWLRRDFPLVFRVCLGFLGNYADAEDLAQESMIKLLDRLEKWSPEKSFRSWRNSVVANLCRDRLRQRKRTAFEMIDPDNLKPKIGITQPQQNAESAELQSTLIHALQSLSPREREVFVLRDLEGVPTAEVATTLAVQESSVRSLLTLARRRLRDLLSKRLDVDGGNIA
ncbi:MAG: RNA polymerase sigma-70 factor (ECF subfamily) [Planctomycetota bacterium]|jgi:RNA polymerase sigma-70 factor (ECF subfamily)